MRVLIVDDHPIYRDGLRRVLEQGGIEVVADASGGREAIALTRVLQPDIVLMDLQMPDVGGLEAIGAIHDAFPEVKVITLTASQDDRDLAESIKAGAQGYLLKDVEATDLFALLERVARGEPVLTPSVARRLWSEFGRPPPRKRQSPDDLTGRELQVIQFMFAGITSNRALAERLVVTENTVRYHLNNIFHKLRAQDKTQAVVYAVRQGLVQTDPTEPGASAA